MSAAQSNLTDAHYGYDFVVATTQGSVNATMQEYLYNTTFTTVQMYWNQDASGNPVVVSRDELLKQTNGTDPLTVPTWQTGEPTTPAIDNIQSSNFLFAFEASIGIPAGLGPGKVPIPPIITLQEASQSIVYTMLCATLTLVNCSFGRHGLISFENDTQPDNAPWEIIATIPLKTLVSNDNLPGPVQDSLNALGPDAFSVQQLLLDLDNALPDTIPTIGGIKPGTVAYTLFSTVFLGAYFAEMKKQKTPVLNYSVVKNIPTGSPSTLTLTALNMEVSPFTPAAGGSPDADLFTLNYLCAANGGALPPAVPFGWNWLEATDTTFDGIIAIKRSDFVDYLSDTCSLKLGDLNIIPNVSMDHSGENMYSSWSFSPGSGAGQVFTTVPVGQAPVGGFTPILSYALTNNSSDDTHDALHTLKMNGEFDYNATVTIGVSGDTIQMVTTMVVYLHFWYGGYYGGQIMEFDGNVIDYTNTVNYTMTVQQDGSLGVSAGTPDFQDTSVPLNISEWDKIIQALIGNMSDTMNDITNQLKPVAQSAMTTFAADIESSLNGYRGWIFPGGKTFSFSDVNFSDYLDFISHITYAKPAQA